MSHSHNRARCHVVFSDRFIFSYSLDCLEHFSSENGSSAQSLSALCHFGAKEVAQMSFINAGGPSDVLSSLIRSLFKLSTRSFEFAASAVMNNLLMVSTHPAR